MNGIGIDVFTPARLPRRPLASDNLKVDGSRHQARSEALLRRYIQINPPQTALWLAFDVDHPAGGLAWDPAGLPQPAWSCTTRKNGHGHVVYGLQMPVKNCSNLASRSVRFLEAVKEAYRRRLDGDPGYTGTLTKNPRHPDWMVERGLQKLWLLDELAEYVELPRLRLRPGDEPQGGLGRNVDSFDRLRYWAYPRVASFRDRGPGGFDAWRAAIDQKMAALDGLNMPPLGEREFKHIAKSVSMWTWKNYTGSGGEFNQHASDCGKLGGRPRTVLLPDEDKPWLAAGVDRSTWYRHQQRQVSGK